MPRGDVVVWLVGAVLLHDAVLWPLYSGADRAGRRLLGAGAINYVRVPLGLSLLLLLVFVGTVTGKGGNAYRNASGQTYDGYVTRWLIVSAALFAISRRSSTSCAVRLGCAVGGQLDRSLSERSPAGGRRGRSTRRGPPAGRRGAGARSSGSVRKTSSAPERGR